MRQLCKNVKFAFGCKKDRPLLVAHMILITSTDVYQFQLNHDW